MSNDQKQVIAEHKKPAKAPKLAPGIRLRATTPYGHLHLTVVVDPVSGHELEIFAQVGKSGELVASELEGLCRLASLYLRSGGSIKDIVKQLVGIGSMLSLREDFKGEREKTHSLPDSLGKSIRAYVEFKEKHGLRSILLGDVVFDEEIVA